MVLLVASKEAEKRGVCNLSRTAVGIKYLVSGKSCKNTLLVRLVYKIKHENDVIIRHIYCDKMFHVPARPSSSGGKRLGLGRSMRISSRLAYTFLGWR